MKYRVDNSQLSNSWIDEVKAFARLMAGYRVTVLPGDGTGKEVMAEAMRVLSVFEKNSPISFEITEIPCGGEYYLETGNEWPEGSFEHCRDNSDAILLGAIGWPGARLPNGDLAGGQVILGLRSGLNYSKELSIKFMASTKISGIQI